MAYTSALTQDIKEILVSQEEIDDFFQQCNIKMKN